MKKIITLLGLLACLSAPELFAQNQDPELAPVLGRLEEKMSVVSSIQTDFVQEKNLAMFKQKVILKGRIFIQKPGLLSWRTFTPMRYSLVINPQSINQWDEDTGQVQSLSLNKNPSFQVAIQQMQNWFSGSYKSMEGDYHIKLVSQIPLELEFIPREKSPAANFIQKVNILFQADEQYIKQISIFEKAGDSTLLYFINPLLNQKIPPKAWEVKSDVR